MAVQFRNSVLAVKPESTENTPVAPTAAGDFVVLQDDFAMEPAFEQLESAELRASIGRGKTIVGEENPTASFSHYLKASGTQGVAPEIDEILTSAFGSEVIASTEYDTVASSTVTDLNVDTGEGAQFQRGQGLLIKDATNGFRIRAVNDVVTDALDLSFSLPNAPASGVNLGKAVLYKPADTGHQPLSIWHYAGNGGALQLMSGAKVTDLGITFNAGELINMNFSFEGLAYYFNPITTTASAYRLRFTDDDVTDYDISLTQKTWKDPHELADALETAMNASGTTEVHTVVYSNSTGKFTFTNTTGATLSLKWTHANTCGALLGFSIGADDTGATTYTSDNAVSFAAAYTPSFDTTDPLVAKSNEIMIGSQTDNACIGANSVEFTMSTPRSIIQSICADSGRSGSVIQSREVTISVQAILNQYDASKFKSFRENEEVRFQYSFGEKSGGNWVAGKCGCLYVPTATISAYSLVDNDGIYNLSLELKAFVNADGEGEVYLSFL